MAMEKLNQTQIAELFAKRSGMSRAAAEQFVKSFFDIIADKVISDGIVKVKGLGTFKLMQMSDRESVNVNTGERITITGHQKISFTPDAELKESLNRPFSAFETVILTDEQAAALEEMEKSDAVTEVPEGPAVIIPEESAAAVPEEPAAAVPEEPAVAAAAEEPAAPASDQAREITQSRGMRITLKIFVWILSIALVLFMLYLLLWPVIGSKALEMMDHERQNAGQVEVPVIEQVAEISEPVEMPSETAADTVPAVPATLVPYVTPVQAPAQAPTQTPAPAPAQIQTPAPAQPAAVTAAPYLFRLSKADEERDLSEFTAADTVNYRMTGTLTEHVMQKGETLTIIAKHEYGTKKLWPYIAAYNHLANFKSLKAGSVILIPKLEHK